MAIINRKYLFISCFLVLLTASGCKLATFPLKSQYVGENKACVWQAQINSGKCPPYVLYYNADQANTLKLNVKNGLVYNALGNLFDTSNADISHTGRAAIFVMNADGEIFASNVNVHFLFHHSTILAGAPVAGAGELVVKSGVIQKITNCSGHYQPPTETVATIKQGLKDLGYTKTNYTFVDCSTAPLVIDLDYNIVGDSGVE